MHKFKREAVREKKKKQELPLQKEKENTSHMKKRMGLTWVGSSTTHLIFSVLCIPASAEANLAQKNPENLPERG